MAFTTGTLSAYVHIKIFVLLLSQRYNNRGLCMGGSTNERQMHGGS